MQYVHKPTGTIVESDGALPPTMFAPVERNKTTRKAAPKQAASK